MSLTAHLHPATVHFPIALLIVASAAGLLYLYWRRLPPLLILTWWTMNAGWVAVGAGILTGLLAQSGLPPAAPYRNILNWHVGTGLALFVVYGWLLYRRWLFNKPSAQRARQHTGANYPDLLDDPQARFGCTLLLILGMSLIVASGWNGGRLVYEWGVNVAR
jgi:uncharacterized membrane protein